jgi:hypothetical protein
MKNNTRKIVVLDNINSRRIEQAIFILRDSESICESDAVSEAHRIINTYLESSVPPSLRAKQRANRKAKLFVAMTLYTLSTVSLTAYLMSFFS